MTILFSNLESKDSMPNLCLDNQLFDKVNLDHKNVINSNKKYLLLFFFLFFVNTCLRYFTSDSYKEILKVHICNHYSKIELKQLLGH